MTAALVIVSDPDARALCSSPTLRLYGDRVEAADLGLPELPAPLVRDTRGWSMKGVSVPADVDGGSVRLRFTNEVPDPLMRVAAVGSWIAIDTDGPSDLRCRAIRWHAGGIAEATLAFGNAYPLAAGISLHRFFRRAGDALPLEVALALVRRAFPLGAPHSVVTWDGEVVALPHRTADRADEVERVHTLLGLIGVDRIALLDVDPAQRALLQDATDYDLFDALILGSEVKHALDCVRARNVDAMEIGEMVRALFQDEWRDEQRLREELATLDAAGVHWLMERAAARGREVS